MSDCGLLLEHGCSHRRGQCELVTIRFSGQACHLFFVMTPFLFDSLSRESTDVLCC